MMMSVHRKILLIQNDNKDLKGRDNELGHGSFIHPLQSLDNHLNENIPFQWM